MWYVNERFLSRLRHHVLRQLGILLYAGLIFVFAALVSGCGGAPQNPSDDGEGLARLELNADSVLDLGEILKDFETLHTITIENRSFAVTASNLQITEGFVMPYTFTGGVYPGTGGTCLESLAPGESCILAVSVIPAAVGEFSESLTVSYNDGSQVQTLVLQLNATAYEPQPALLTFSDIPLFDFGLPAIGSVTQKIFTVTNSGDLNATAAAATNLTAPYSYTGGTYPGTNGTCGSVISAGSCTVAVDFAPSTTDVASASLSINYDDGKNPQVASVDLTGQGRVAASLVVDEGLVFDHGIVLSGQFVDQTLSLRNNGGEPASALSMNGFSSGFTRLGGSCGASLAPSATCTIVVRYLAAGTIASAIGPQISYNDSFLVQNLVVNFSGQSFGNSLTVSRISPAASPGITATPTLQIGGLISGLTARLFRNSACSLLVSAETSTGALQSYSPTLSEGPHTFRARVEDDHGNQTPCSPATAEYTYDNTNPNPVTNVTLASNYTTNATLTPNWTWTHSTSTDRATYELGLSVNPAGGNDYTDWVDKGLVTSANLTGLSLPECTDYYPSVRVTDAAGRLSTVAVGIPQIRYDSAVPTPPSSLVTSGDATDTNSATVAWTASSDACGIDHYEIAIGRDTNGNLVLDASEIGNVVAFKSSGATTSHRENGLALDTAVNYYTSVRAVDTSGRLSGQAHSPPYIIYDPSIELPDMIVWLDAGDPTTVIDSGGSDANAPGFNGSVRTWQDKSGSPVVHNFSTSSGAVDALFDGAAYSLLFNGTTTGMTTPNHDEINTATVVQRNITVAFQTSADVTSRQLLYDEGGNIRGMNVYIFNGRLYCGFYNNIEDGDGPQPFTSVNRVISPNTIYFVTWVFDYTNFTNGAGPDGNLDCYVNDAHVGNQPTTSRLHAHSGAVGLGHINNTTCVEDATCPASGSPFFGELFEFMIFNNAPNAAAVSNVHTYLDNKWN